MKRRQNKKFRNTLVEYNNKVVELEDTVFFKGQIDKPLSLIQYELFNVSDDTIIQEFKDIRETESVCTGRYNALP
jgi:hypothetical protein